ncbi:MAG: hypothetical protein NT135_00355 [Candidatus Berkelbacteria bacterium]|nr:hypothetical protein [Candidatus Berkelbacteria bacterium]
MKLIFVKKITIGFILCLIVFSFAQAAQEIKNVKAVRDGSKIVVTWDAVSGMEYYKVFKKDGNIYPVGGKVTNTSFTMQNAQTSSEYVFNVRGYTSDTSSAPDAQGQTSVTSASSGSSSSSSSSTLGEGVEVGAKFPGEPSGKVGLIEHIRYVHAWAAIIGSLLAVYMIVFAAFKYATSSGNPEALQDAKDTIIGALVGLAIIIATYSLLQFILGEGNVVAK